MIPLMKNTFLNEFETKKALAEFIIKSDRLSMGPKCEEFEMLFSERQKRQYSILFNSGGSANLALLQSLLNLGDLKKGDSVGFSALTWSTNVMPIIQLGLVPVAIDISTETLNVHSDHLINELKKTELKAMFLTNVLGFVGDIQSIKEICNERGVILLEDNCESLGTQTENGFAGNFGLASSFSFFVAHHMSTIEGGMVCTDNESLAEMLQIVRANGWDRNLNAKQQLVWRRRYDIRSEFQAKYTFFDLGYNLRPTEITGFLGVEQLQYLDENIEKRQQNYFEMENIMLNNSDLIPLKHEHISVLSTFAIPIVCKDREIKEFYMQQFSGAGIEIRPMIAGNMQNQPFYKKYVSEIKSLPGTDFIHENGFYCGNYPELTKTDLNTIASALSQF